MNNVTVLALHKIIVGEDVGLHHCSSTRSLEPGHGTRLHLVFRPNFARSGKSCSLPNHIRAPTSTHPYLMHLPSRHIDSRTWTKSFLRWLWIIWIRDDELAFQDQMRRYVAV